MPGGAIPSRKQSPETEARAAVRASTAESLPLWKAEPMIATVSDAAANASRRMRPLATPGWPRPARQRRTVTTTESSDQWMRKRTTYAVNHHGRASPVAGKRGNANVPIESTIVIAATNRCRRWAGGAKTVAKR